MNEYGSVLHIVLIKFLPVLFISLILWFLQISCHVVISLWTYLCSFLSCGVLGDKDLFTITVIHFCIPRESITLLGTWQAHRKYEHRSIFISHLAPDLLLRVLKSGILSSRAFSLNGFPWLCERWSHKPAAFQEKERASLLERDVKELCLIRTRITSRKQ